MGVQISSKVPWKSSQNSHCGIYHKVTHFLWTSLFNFMKKRKKNTGHYYLSLFFYNFRVNWLSNFICSEQNKKISRRLSSKYILIETEKRESYDMANIHYTEIKLLHILSRWLFSFFLLLLLFFFFALFDKLEKCSQAAIAITSATCEKLQTYWQLITCKSESFSSILFAWFNNSLRTEKKIVSVLNIMNSTYVKR